MFRFVSLLCERLLASKLTISEQHKPVDVITLFHAPSLSASVRAHNLLKQLSAQASATATEDQAADHSAQNKIQRSQFELNVTEDNPTKDQLRTILEYLGAKKAGRLVEGAENEADALKKLGEDSKRFRRPVVSCTQTDLHLHKG